jgi:hypothetical protein
MVLPNVLQEQSGYSRGFDIGTGDEVGHFRQATGDNHNIGTSLTGGQFGHKIDGDMFPSTLGDGQRFQEALILLSGRLHSGAYMTACHISSDSFVHRGPVVLPLQQFQSLGSAIVATNGGIVDISEQFQFQFVMVGDNKPVLVI